MEILYLFNVNGPILEKNKILYCHNGQITPISINENLNMFASSSIDRYINIYILSSFRIILSI